MRIPDDPRVDGGLADEPGPAKGPARGSGPLILAWAIVFALNLSVPLVLGWDMTRGPGRLGMVAGTLALFGAGCYACRSSRQLAMAITTGGGFVAITQAFPVAQIFVGMLGVGLAQAMRQTTSGDDGISVVSSGLGGFVATILTGTLLMILALGIGLLIDAFRARSGRATA